MKRSQINAIIRDFEAMLREYRFALPPFLSFTPEEWKDKGHEYDEIRDNALGWDITDYGEGNAERDHEVLKRSSPVSAPALASAVMTSSM